MNNQDLINKIKQLEGLTDTERAELVNLLNTDKKYGLIWEDKPEDVEEQLRTQLPVLREVTEKRILASKKSSETEVAEKQTLKKNEVQQILFESDDSDSSTLEASPKGGGLEGAAPNHILIEGDNLHALTALTFTHEEKIDVIYIDPPYNTGNKDFKYNDAFVDKEDSYRHSKWLSFMHKRLQIAKRLLSEKGVIFISIDDNEQAQLKLLCDEVFGENNFIGVFLKQSKVGGGSDSKFIVKEHEYAISYSKRIDQCGEFFVEHNRDYLKRYKEKDEKGFYFWDTFARPGLKNPINYEIEAPDGSMIYNGWIRSKERFQKEYKDGEIKIIKRTNSWSVQFKQRLNIDGKKPRSMTNDFGGTIEGKNEIRDIFNDDRKFSYPKSTKLISTLISFVNSIGKNSIILDFFAGSGTTLHATMQLNAEDGGNRQCILVTNNENNICEEVTYERNKRVIQGYTNAKGVQVEGLTNNNLRYYQTDFIPSSKTEQNKRLLTKASTELLKIKEDCYTDITEINGFDSTVCTLFTNEKGKYLIVVYHSRKPMVIIEKLVKFIKNLTDKSEKVKLYGFSPEKETLVEDFWEVADEIEAVPLPEAIYNAYRATFRTMKLENKPAITATDTSNEQTSEE